MALTAPERETIISINDEDERARIYSSQRPWLTKLKKNPSAVLLAEGKFEGSPWAEFELPKGLVSLRSRKVKLDLTEEERQARTARLQKRK